MSWIRVAEQKPQNRQRVLILLARKPETATFFEGRFHKGNDTVAPKFWMPLPEAPEETKWEPDQLTDAEKIKMFDKMYDMALSEIRHLEEHRCESHDFEHWAYEETKRDVNVLFAQDVADLSCTRCVLRGERRCT
jgi:hypothetical protein